MADFHVLTYPHQQVAGKGGPRWPKTELTRGKLKFRTLL